MASCVLVPAGCLLLRVGAASPPLRTRFCNTTGTQTPRTISKPTGRLSHLFPCCSLTQVGGTRMLCNAEERLHLISCELGSVESREAFIKQM